MEKAMVVGRGRGWGGDHERKNGAMLNREADLLGAAIKDSCRQRVAISVVSKPQKQKHGARDAAVTKICRGNTQTVGCAPGAVSKGLMRGALLRVPGVRLSTIFDKVQENAEEWAAVEAQHRRGMALRTAAEEAIKQKEETAEDEKGTEGSGSFLHIKEQKTLVTFLNEHPAYKNAILSAPAGPHEEILRGLFDVVGGGLGSSSSFLEEKTIMKTSSGGGEGRLWGIPVDDDLVEALADRGLSRGDLQKLLKKDPGYEHAPTHESHIDDFSWAWSGRSSWVALNHPERYWSRMRISSSDFHKK